MTRGDRVHANTALAYSMASDLVAALRAPSSTKRGPRHGGHRVLDEARGDLDTWPACFSISATASCVAWKNRRVDAQDGEKSLGVLVKAFDENAGVIDERVDAPEPCHALGDRAFRVFRSAMSPGTVRMSARSKP